MCGPLSRDEVGHFFAHTSAENALPKNAPLWRIVAQPSLPTVKKVFDSTPKLRQLCSAIMALRTADHLSYSAPLPEQLRCIAAARYALMCGEVDEFRRLHRLYRGIPRIGVQPDSPRPEFWDGVLGNEWLGVELLPVGQAREEIGALRAARYMLQPLPAAGAAPEMDKLPYLLSLGWGLLRADMQLKPRPSDKVGESRTRDEDVLVARAYWNLWAGSWENAFRGFLRLFRSREAQVSAVAEPYGGAVLLVACIAAIRSHAPERTVSLWLSMARELMLRALSESDEEARADISAFFDSLTLWDAVENRGSRHFVFPPQHGPLASIPLAMGAQAIMRHTGIHLPIERLVHDIRLVHRRGLHLLSFYAYSSLAQAPGVEVEALLPVSDVGRDCSFRPLYDRTRKRRSKVTDEQWSQLISIVENQRAGQRWLYWDIALDRSGAITRLEPRLVERRPHAPGKKLELDDVQDPALLDCQDKQDLAVLSLARSLESKQLRGVPLLAEALVGHPRVRVVEGTYHRPVQVVPTTPVIHSAMETFALKLSLDVEQLSRLRVDEDEALLYVPAFSARMQMLVDYFSHGPVSLNLTHTEQLRWLLARLRECFEIEGRVPESLLEYKPAEPQFIIHASVYDNGYLFDMDVKHHPDSTAHDIPGQGERVQLLKLTGGEQLCVMRDFEAEKSAALALAECSPVLSSTEAEDFQWLLPTQGEALQALYELGEAGVSVQWQSAVPPLSMVEPLWPGLQLRVVSQGEHWLEIGARLAVNEERVLELMELMELYERRAGNFLPLEEKVFLRMPPQLAEQVQRLAESLRRERKRYVLPLVALPGFAAGWQGEPLPGSLLGCTAALEESRSALPPAGLVAELRDYQLEGYRWLLARARLGFGACLADDMGLGKTLQALALMVELAAAGPSLVVAPASLSRNWHDEAARFAPGLCLRPCAEVKSEPADSLRPGDVVVATYGQLTTNESYFCSVSWNVVALDEAQAIKNPASRRAAVACQLRARVRLALTGTPVENSLLDLWSLMQYLNPGLLGDKSQFAPGGSARAAKADPARVSRITAPFILRRKKEDVLPQLPPLTEVTLRVDFNDEERSLYEGCRRKARSRARAGSSPATLLSELTRLRRMCCHGKLVQESYAGESSKLRVMSRLVQDLLEADHSMLIFSQFTDVLDLAQEELRSQQISALRLDGGTPPKERGEQVRLFQEGEARVFLISLRAGGVGLNLTAADYVILLDPWWNPAVEAQAASRSHRYGQNNPVTLCRLIARDTVEERIMQVHGAKQVLAESVIHEGAMPLEVLRELLK